MTFVDYTILSSSTSRQSLEIDYQAEQFWGILSLNTVFSNFQSLDMLVNSLRRHHPTVDGVSWAIVEDFRNQKWIGEGMFCLRVGCSRSYAELCAQSQCPHLEIHFMDTIDNIFHESSDHRDCPVLIGGADFCRQTSSTYSFIKEVCQIQEEWMKVLSVRRESVCVCERERERERVMVVMYYIERELSFGPVGSGMGCVLVSYFF